MITLLDFETTGLVRPGKDTLPGITQIGAIKLDADLEEIDSFVMDVNPELIPSDWEEGAIKLRGIGPGDLDTEPTFFAAFFPFADFVRGSVIWCGHNINGFDTKVLHNNLRRYGFEAHFPWPTYHIDTMDLVVKEYGKRKKLGDVYKDITGKKLEGAHEALPDIRATAVILREYGKAEAQQYLRRVK